MGTARALVAHLTLGDVGPGEYFTHAFADIELGGDAKSEQRWIDLAVKVSGG